MTRINIIGAGKVGTTLLHLFRKHPRIVLGEIYRRRYQVADAEVDQVEGGRVVANMEDMSAADLWLLTVPDDQIAPTAIALAAEWAGKGRVSPTVVHCSGFLSSEELAPLRAIGWAVASCHPVLSFADPDAAVKQFPGTYCGIEGDARAVEQISKVISYVGGVPFSVQTEKKALYHAAAVLSNNFTVVLQALALEAWAAASVPEEVAKNLCAALLYNTAENVTRSGPRTALTGPAARGDIGIMRRQELSLAEWHQDVADLYHLMSKMARNLKQTGDIASHPHAQSREWEIG